MVEKEERTQRDHEVGKPRSSQYDAHTSKMAKVDEIYKSLDQAHGNVFTSEQKRAWAHLIKLGKHSYQSVPPNKPFFPKASRQRDHVNRHTITWKEGQNTIRVY